MSWNPVPLSTVALKEWKYVSVNNNPVANTESLNDGGWEDGCMCDNKFCPMLATCILQYLKPGESPCYKSGSVLIITAQYI